MVDLESQILRIIRHVIIIVIFQEVEVKPYVLDGQQCDECHGGKCDGRFVSPPSSLSLTISCCRSAPYFCGDMQCLQYYCVTCWDDMHYNGPSASRAKHCPLVRLGDQTKVGITAILMSWLCIVSKYE